ncbi:hypothetical protein C8Q76DRAFT_623277, partial [Earliella scabrosa]
IRSFVSKVVFSTTKLGPAWKTTCAELGLDEKFIPWDVRTQWNSTYDMLLVTYTYRKAVDKLCGAQANGLRDFEMSADEWAIVKQLQGVLKVRVLPFECFLR